MSFLSKIFFGLFALLAIFYLGADFSASEGYFLPWSATASAWLFLPFVFIGLTYAALRVADGLRQGGHFHKIYNFILTIVVALILALLAYLKYFAQHDI